MIVENVPNYVGATHGLVATYQINFAADPSHCIPLNGSFQGSPVYALALYVNNINNSSGIDYVDQSGDGGTIPAYNSGTIDIAEFRTITLACNNPVTILFKVFTTNQISNLSQRGQAPNNQFTQIKVGENVLTGDVIVLHDDALGYWADNTPERLVYNSASTTHGKLVINSAGGGFINGTKFSILSNGNVVGYMYQAAGTRLYYFVSSKTGAGINGGGIALTILPTFGRCVMPLNNVFLMYTPLTNTLQYAVCNNDGSVAVGVAQLLNLPFTIGGAVTKWQCNNVKLTGGNSLAVFGYITSNTFMGLGTFVVDSNGMLLNGPNPLLGGTQGYTNNDTSANNRPFAICASNDGGAFVCYVNETANNSTIISLDSGGKFVSSYVIAGKSTNNLTPTLFTAANGNLYCLRGNGGNTYIDILTPSLVLIATLNYNGVEPYPPCNGIIVDDGNGGVNVLFVSTEQLYAICYINVSSGNAIAINRQLYLNLPGLVLIVKLSFYNGVIGVMYTNAGSFMLAGAFTLAGALLGSIVGPTTLYTFIGNGEVTPNNGGEGVGPYMYGYNNNGQYAIFSFYLSSSTPIGISQGNAANGSNATIQMLGSCNTRLSFSPAVAVNAQAANPPGQKMVLLGNLANMLGLSS